MFNPRLIKGSLAGALVIAAASFSLAAPAMAIGGGGGSVPVAPPATGSGLQQRLDQLQRNVEELFAAEGGWHLSAASAPSVSMSSEGFQWADAGMGAAGATVLLVAGAFGVGMTRRRRRVAVG